MIGAKPGSIIQWPLLPKGWPIRGPHGIGGDNGY